MKHIVLIGGSGLIGSHFLNLIINNSLIEKIYLITRTAYEIKHPKITNLVINFEELAQLKLDTHKACFVSCLGTTIRDAGSQDAFLKVDFTYNYEFAKLAKKNNADQFILVSSIGANKDSTIYYSKVKGQLEVEIMKLNFPSLVIIQPSLLLGHRKKIRPAEQFMQYVLPKLSRILIGKLQKYRPVDAHEVALAIFNSLQQPQPGVKVLTYQEIVSKCLQ